MRRPLIAGNWKMNCTRDETTALIEGLKNIDPSCLESGDVEMAVCPPFTSLETASRRLVGTRIKLGAQNMSEHESGAYTGEVSARMLLTLGVTFVILGHSERRQYYAESDSLVNAKARRALDTGLTPIICVGEVLEDREAGRTEDVVGTQVDGTLSGFSADDLRRIVIAYEPVWAIGTGKNATPEQAQETHQFIRGKVAERDREVAETIRILYGGSMKPSNSGELLAQPDVDGGLIGGASLKADDFLGIVESLKAEA
jgi:triosephosphate isomerase